MFEYTLCPPPFLHPEVEGFFYSIVSLFHIVPPDRGQEFIDLMCQKVTVSASKENGAFKLRL